MALNKTYVFCILKFEQDTKVMKNNVLYTSVRTMAK